MTSWQELVNKMKETMSDVQQPLPRHGPPWQLTACSKKYEPALGGQGLLAGGLWKQRVVVPQLTRVLDEIRA